MSLWERSAEPIFIFDQEEVHSSVVGDLVLSRALPGTEAFLVVSTSDEPKLEELAALAGRGLVRAAGRAAGAVHWQMTALGAQRMRQTHALGLPSRRLRAGRACPYRMPAPRGS